MADKKINCFGVLMGLILALGCTQQKDYKAERDEVIKFHDAVMEDQTKVMNNQMKLDSMLQNFASFKFKFPVTDTLKEKDSIRIVKAHLVKAGESMDTWMHEFEPDITGKSNEEAVKYFKGERIKIAKIDSLFKQEIKLSDTYLSKFMK